MTNFSLIKQPYEAEKKPQNSKRAKNMPSREWVTNGHWRQTTPKVAHAEKMS